MYFAFLGIVTACKNHLNSFECPFFSFLFSFFPIPTPNGYGCYYGTLMIHDYKVGVAFNVVWDPPPKWIRQGVGRGFPPLIPWRNGKGLAVWKPSVAWASVITLPCESVELERSIFDTDYPILPYPLLSEFSGHLSHPYLEHQHGFFDFGKNLLPPWCRSTKPFRQCCCCPRIVMLRSLSLLSLRSCCRGICSHYFSRRRSRICIHKLRT